MHGMILCYARRSNDFEGVQQPESNELTLVVQLSKILQF